MILFNLLGKCRYHLDSGSILDKISVGFERQKHAGRDELSFFHLKAQRNTNVFQSNKNKGYDPHKLHGVQISQRKCASRNFQYERYSRNDVMKLNLYVSCSHDYCADPNNIIFQVWKKYQS